MRGFRDQRLVHNLHVRDDRTVQSFEGNRTAIALFSPLIAQAGQEKSPRFFVNANEIVSPDNDIPVTPLASHFSEDIRFKSSVEIVNEHLQRIAVSEPIIMVKH